MISKRGISPVIASILLVAIVLVVGVIIFVWLSSLNKEETTKFNKPIKEACDDVNIAVTQAGDSVSVNNEGNVGIYSLKVKTSDGGNSDLVSCSGSGIPPGGSGTFTCSGSGFTKAIPVLQADDKSLYICEKNEVSF